MILKSNRLMAEEVLEKRTKHFATVLFLLNLPKLSFGKIYFLPLLSTRLLAVRSSSPVVSAWFELQFSTIQLSAMVKETVKLTNTSTITSLNLIKLFKVQHLVSNSISAYWLIDRYKLQSLPSSHSRWVYTSSKGREIFHTRLLRLFCQFLLLIKIYKDKI